MNTNYMGPPGTGSFIPFRPQMNAGPPQKCPWQMQNQPNGFYGHRGGHGQFNQNGTPPFNRPPPPFNRPPPQFNRPQATFNRPPPPFNQPMQNIYKENIFGQNTFNNNNTNETFATPQAIKQQQGPFPQHSGPPGPNLRHQGPNSGPQGPNSNYPGPNSGHQGPNSNHLGPNSVHQGPNSAHQGPNSGHRGRGHGGFRGRGRGSNNSFNNNNTFNKQQKKEKIDKRDLPENNVHYCDTCDRGFKTLEKYQEHVDGHIKCNYKDCPFIAAPKLVQLHMNMQHRNGIANKIYSLQSEEDLKKWRDERKKHFPTSENIEKKKQEQADKIARGEVVETKDFSKMHGKGRDHSGRGRNGRGRDGRGRGRGRRNNRKWKDFDEQSQQPESLPNNETVPNIDSDDEGPTEIPNQRPPPEENHDNAGKGLSLLANYGDSSGDEDTNNNQLKKSLADKNQNNEDLDSETPSLQEVVKALSADVSIKVPESGIHGSSNLKRKSDGNIPERNKPKKSKVQVPAQRKYTLLEKLLAPEIRKERNVILQCVHYIVKNNFFDVDANSDNTYTASTSTSTNSN